MKYVLSGRGDARLCCIRTLTVVRRTSDLRCANYRPCSERCDVRDKLFPCRKRPRLRPSCILSSISFLSFVCLTAVCFCRLFVSLSLCWYNERVRHLNCNCSILSHLVYSCRRNINDRTLLQKITLGIRSKFRNTIQSLIRIITKVC